MLEGFSALDAGKEVLLDVSVLQPAVVQLQRGESLEALEPPAYRCECSVPSSAPKVG